MADILAVYDAEPVDLPQGQRAFAVGNYWAVTTAGEPSPNEVKLFRLWQLLDQKGVVTTTDMATAVTGDTEKARLAGMAADTGVQTLLSQAKTATVAQIDTWLTNNVTTLAQARAVLAAIIKVLAIQAG
ncbi:MAG TPA: hypothetical protein VIY48_19925 [Candidatus Paceibacterota bacterium]